MNEDIIVSNEKSTSHNNEHETETVLFKFIFIFFQEFQRSLGAKQPIYDTVQRMGRVLKEKATDNDVPVIGALLYDAKLKWNNICSKSVER